ncbi:hypothetical protein HPB47_007285 [Ixodes persulcatus]|uniref:Uncharacterized protein n=1 Tax=Ixodes persulcatus TaxID=34615 RepID=A0AC60P840_IXOPE|nr:hypothetical protein HPB47_007285 [Ixodes persulcatus]
MPASSLICWWTVLAAATRLLLEHVSLAGSVEGIIVKSTSHLKYASEHGVTLMTFDSAEELVKMDDKNARHFPPSSGVKIIAEPGQFFVTAAYSLVVRVVGKRHREICIDGVVRSYVDVFINESKDNCVSRNLYPFLDIQLHPLNPPFDRPRNVLTSLWGATCNPIDRMEERTLMFDVAVDEWLFMDNMGAYGLVRATGFNGFGFPFVKYITNADKKPSVQRIVDSMLMRGGYGQVEEAIMARHPSKHIRVADAGAEEKGLEA